MRPRSFFTTVFTFLGVLFVLFSGGSYVNAQEISRRDVMQQINARSDAFRRSAGRMGWDETSARQILEEGWDRLTNPASFVDIPEGSGITSASLNIYQYVSPSSSTNFWCSMITDSWNLSDYNSGARNAFTNASKLNLEFLSSSSSKKGWHSFDIRTAVNNWFNGLDAQNGLMITGQYDTESENGGAFVTNTSAGAAGAGTYAANKPYIIVNWEIPNPVDPNYDINNTTIDIRTIGTSSRDGKLAILGVFADGVAKPNATVNYAFSDSSAEGQTSSTAASVSYKYPDSTAWNEAFASQGRATKYKDILSNWQTAVPFTKFNYNQVYNWTATATKDGITGNTAKSVDFLVYKITRYDTLASIANYYGVPVDKLATDNHVQDMLLVENNTIIVIIYKLILLTEVVNRIFKCTRFNLGVFFS